MNMKKILAAILALVTVLGTLAALPVGAVNTRPETPTSLVNKTDEGGNPIIAYLSEAYNTEEAKLADMTLMREQNGYRLYMEEFTGEVAFQNIATGEVLFSNPYDVAQGRDWASTSTRRKLLSQISVAFDNNGVSEEMYSYEEAALRGQIISKNIKNGIRVEYTVGELATTRLVPRMISKTRFQSMILQNIPEEDANYNTLISFYRLYDTSDTSLTERMVKEIQAAFPITKQFAVYVCSTDISYNELQKVEKIIKAYCPNYTYEEMDQDHADCDYTVSDKAPPNFKMAIEYTIGEDGSLEARLPANGIRFDEANFNLKTITLLPYMGCGSAYNTGYNFIPDGSGALIRFEDVFKKTYNVSGQMYGPDYAYHTISGQNSETMRLPVFGIVSTKVLTNEYVDPITGQPVTEETGTANTGFLAIITEGDSMATLMSEHGGLLHCYNAVYAKFNPRPYDSYNIADSISVSASKTRTVVSKRKYAGSYKIKYVMLSDADDKGYSCDYVGMANAYRDYLENTGAITKLTSETSKKNIPLYIEAFGSLKTKDKFLSFPVEVNTPLTTFDDVKAMYDELTENGVGNINFRLTGFYNGGLDHTYLAKLDWVDEIGGEDGFEDLIKYAKEKDFGLFPDFDMAYVKNTAWFDGVEPKTDFVKSIDDRYMSKRNYDAAVQSFESDYAVAVTPSVFDRFCDELEENIADYKELGLTGLSLSTLGTDLNSDFDEDDPYNREDSKLYTMNVLERLSENYSVMVDGGNAYSIGYADHLIGIPTDSSNFLNASESVPFAALVLHGYVNYTGAALNMEGDVQYALLKSVENGANLYFTLCYQNTNSLKESDKYNRYYSVSYDIWKDDIAKYYAELNEALADLQTMSITGHEFMTAFRTITEEEKQAQELSEEEKKALEEAAKKEEERQKKRAELEASRGKTPSNSSSSHKPTNNNASSTNTSLVQVESGSVVRVEYENGVNFIINYNSYDVDVEYNGTNYSVEALSFIRID